LDPLQSTYCSKVCQQAAEAHWNTLLFAAVPPPTPTNPTPKRTKAQVEERRKVQEAFVTKLKDEGKLAPLLVTRFIGRMVEDEHEKIVHLMEGSTVEGQPKKVKTGLPEPEGEVEYSFWDHMERLRYLEILPNPADQEVCKSIQDLLKVSVEGLEEFVVEERYLILKGKCWFVPI
jgi:import receptor subunit TOM20